MGGTGSTLKARPNHYELLGLKSTASGAEIAEGFASAMRRPHLMADVARIGVAFDTLRSPAKRRAYDEALGLRREPEPKVAAPAMSFPVTARLAALAAPAPLEPPPAVDPPSREVSPLPPKAEMPKPAHDPWIEPPMPDFLTAGRNSTSRTREAEERVVDWRYLAFTMGFIVLAAVLIGAWAGAHAQDGDAPKSAEVALGAPAVKPAPDVGVRAGAVDLGPAATTPVRIARKPAKSERLRRAPASEDRLAEIDQSLDDASAQDAAADSNSSQPAAVTAANLPLPNAVVARTIERIGYGCGAVVSTTAVESGSPGVFKVTCTSGQSYQAKPVRGRYHFKRW